MLLTASMQRLQTRIDELRRRAARSWTYQHPDVTLRVDWLEHDGHVQILWHVERLGGPLPGGMHCLLDSRLELRRDGQAVAVLPVVRGARPLSGLEAFFRMRGELMPMYPRSARLSLPDGRYEICFVGTSYDCTNLVRFCESFGDLYHFEVALPVYEKAQQDLIDSGACIGDVQRLPQASHDAVVGTVDVRQKRLDPPAPYATNEISVELPDWSEAARQPLPSVTRRESSDASPERYWRKPIDTMLAAFRQWSTCPFQSAPFTVGGDIRSTGSYQHTARPCSFYVPALEAMYELTGIADYYHATWFCFETARLNWVEAPWGGVVTDFSDGVGSHVLGLRDTARPMLAMYRLWKNPGLLDPVARTLERWTYYFDRHHCQMGRTIFDPREYQDNPIYNMVMAWWEMMVTIGLETGNDRFLTLAADCWEYFFLPGLQPEGFWFYRPGREPPGSGDHVTHSYDMTIKAALARMLCYEWVRALPRMTDVMRLTVDLYLRRFAQRRGGITLLDAQANYNSAGALQQLNRTSILLDVVTALARYVDPSYVTLVQETLRGCYTLRDHPDIHPRQWEASQYSNLFASLLGVPLQGFVLSGPADAPVVALP